MPSLTLPNRRPFTERGKRMGQLTVCVAGGKGMFLIPFMQQLLIRGTGSGKSSLIRAIIQHCDDIVHVDAAQEISSLDNLESFVQEAQSLASPGAHRSRLPIQLKASTKAYPAWFLDLEESATSKRRPSSGVESRLDRNISFVEFPACEPGQSTINGFTSSFMEKMFMHTGVGPVESEQSVMEILSGSDGHLIDVVLYLFSSSK